MAGCINRPVAANGIIAFQDRENPELFEYFPSNVKSVLGETIDSFSCKYYGIGKSPQWVQSGNNNYMNLAGGVVSGKAVFDATQEQLGALKEAIQKYYKVDNPNLVPARLSETTAQPVFAQGVAQLGGASKSVFPDAIGVGESFNFNIDSGNSLFAQLIASQNMTDRVDTPDVGMNIKGKLELYGEPFKAKIYADLSQVWSYVRDQVSAKASFGWFNFGSEFDSIAQDLQKKNIIQIEFLEGRADSEFGLQLLESTKKVFEAINAQITAGEGMFKFEPNPAPQEPTKPGESWFASLAPWSVAINTSFIRNSFKQSIIFDETISYQGIYTIEVYSSMNLGMVCNSKTKDMFFDVTTNENGCITEKKMTELQVRISKEVMAKEKQIKEWEQKLIDGKIDLKTYEFLTAQLNSRMLTEFHSSDRRTARDVIHEIEEAVDNMLGVAV